MNKRTFRLGCLFASLLVSFLLVVSGGWWFFRSQSNAAESPPTSPVNVILISPASGDELNAGDFAPVTAQAVAPTAIQSTELFVDGKSLGVVTDSPQNATWTWQAWPVGVHTLYARATAADGQAGQSQTVIINVLAGDGMIQVPAAEGQTLDQVGAGFGVPPDQMAEANPHVDPTQPLTDGQPVQVPVGDAGAGNGSGAGSGQTPPPGNGGTDNSSKISIIWNFKFTEPVDKSYCYTSNGDGKWEKMPKDPFNFFQSLDNLYTQFDFIFPEQESVIQMQCWGWLGEALKYLGEGETKFDINQPPGQLVINGQGFQSIGIPNIPIPVEEFTGLEKKIIPPPYALRESENTADCLAHKGNLVICEQVLNAKVQSDIVLEWEWEPKINWPGYDIWLNEIEGYYTYIVDPQTNTTQFMKTVTPPAAKVVAIPLPWGYYCYGVKAFGKLWEQVSEMAVYCPGQQPAVQKITLYPNAWVTTGGQWIESGDCSDFGELEPYLGYNQDKGFGNQVGEIMVGTYIVDDSGCFKQGDYAGGVKFLPNIPPGAVIQKAVLKFSKVLMDYGSPGWASPKPSSCVASVNKAIQDWSGYSTGNHYTHSISLYSPKLSSPITSMSQYAPLEVEVTSAVKDWFQHPAQDYGLVLTSAGADAPKDDGYGRCLSGLSNFQLDVYYFAP